MTNLLKACIAAAKVLWPMGVCHYMFGDDDAAREAAMEEDWKERAGVIQKAIVESGLIPTWHPVEELPERLHSTAMQIKPVLILIPGIGWRIGWYNGLLEWQQSGSNSEVHPTHFMDIDATIGDIQ